MPLLLAALVPYLVLVVAHWSIGPTVESGDYAQYLLHAKALIEGRPYGDIGYIFTPYAFVIGPPLQPPGFPVTIAPVVALFGTATPLLKGFVVLSGAAFLLFAGLYLSRLADPLKAAIAVAFAGVALETSFATNTAMPDLGFAALLWAGFLLVDAPARLSTARVAGVAALGVAACSYRAAGLALLPAMALYALVNRERRRLAVAVLAGWMFLALVVLVVAPEAIPFGEQFQQLHRLAERLWRFTNTIRAPLFESQLYPLPSNRANDLYHVVSTAVLAIGAAVVWWQQRRAVIWCFAVAYLGMLAVSPVAAGRYFWPLYPLAAFCLTMGAFRVASMIRRPPAGAVMATTGLLLVLSAAMIRTLRQPPPDVLAEYPGIQPLYTWFRELAAREPVRAMFANPRVLTLETGVPAMSVVAAPRERVLAEIEGRGITHVVMGDPVGRERPAARVLQEVLASAAERFTLEYQNPSFAVYRVNGSVPP